MKKHLTLLALALSLGIPAVQAGPIYQSSQRVLASNIIGGSGYGTDLVTDARATTTDGTTASSGLIGSIDISGTDSSNVSATMTLSYDSKAEVSAGGIKTKASATLTNGFYNPSANNPFVTNTSFNTDPNGVPESFSVESTARYQDSFTVSGDSSLSYVQFALNLDGTFSGNQASVIQLVQLLPSWSTLFSGNNLSGGATVNELIMSNAVIVINGVADLGLALFASIQYDFYDDFFDNVGTDSLTGVSDFFNTLTIGEVSGFDVQGNAVDLISATDSSGVQFGTVRVQQPTTGGTVPEPSSLALFAIGGLFALFRRKRVV